MSMDKPQTNADWIRSMSDKELAEFLMHDYPCESSMDRGCAGTPCDECVRKWLAEEYSEQEGATWQSRRVRSTAANPTAVA